MAEDAKSILITGCSSGIGHHAAHALQKRGWHVLATARKPEDVARLNAEGLTSFQLDLADDTSVANGSIEALERTNGKLFALFNNGAFAIPGAAEDLPRDALRSIFETNFFGQFDLANRLLPAMRANGRGRIINNSSILGFSALRFRGAYNSTKFAMEGFTDTMRLENRAPNIKIILMEPGPIRTMIRQKSQIHFERWIDPENSAYSGLYRKHLIPRLYAQDGTPDRFELTCEATTKKLIHAIESPRPKIRYLVTTPTYIAWFMRGLLPIRLSDAIQRRL
jgi:NAD(P)-dependent dehydrogenase (short-subunit alcohol dehydrogenase family)